VEEELLVAGNFLNMKNFSFFLLFSSLFLNCQNTKNITIIADLPKALNEVSGNEIVQNDSLIWMLNDSGNQPKIFGVSIDGKIIKEVFIDAKNKDWEDITSDAQGNIYIGDFGNNDNDRKHLRILKVNKADLNKDLVPITKIEFEYEDQKKYPPKKKKRYFDAEAFFYFNSHFYVFTKTHIDDKYGRTHLYKIPAKEGNHEAELLGEFDNGDKHRSWITGADISNDGKTVALLSQKNILIFSNFEGDDFFSGDVRKIKLEHKSQKEGICFKDNKTLLITDERSSGEGGNLYELKL